MTKGLSLLYAPEKSRRIACIFLANGVPFSVDITGTGEATRMILGFSGALSRMESKTRLAPVIFCPFKLNTKTTMSAN
ncbi:hypothetical protein AADEFJLK_03266 [Methylovulum psychrotolerans]|uniref:Uncharacterized protein n=1 Tax=Methylovulum psychrotolerans TaxID=1704499 RepID=A0A2S5CJ23_9GAMM|nr:hypothetical protein AADEFJLK_03266 [Methylovulum psychrotolerans]